MNKFGYSEMYEWKVIPPHRLGRFVMFDKEVPNKIRPYEVGNDLLGITTVNSIVISDGNDEEWRHKNYSDEYGDILLSKEQVYISKKQYDDNLEIPVMACQPILKYFKLDNTEYNKELKYIKRTNRPEWVCVNLLGKVIVEDNGKCIPGGYCQPYIGNNKSRFGTAIPYIDSINKYYVLERLTDTTILILNK